MGLTSTVVAAAGWACVLAIAYRFSKKSEAGPIRVSIGVGVLIGIVFDANICIKMGGSIAVSRILEPAVFGEAAIWSSYSGWLVQLFVFVSSIVMLCLLNEKAESCAVE